MLQIRGSDTVKSYSFVDKDGAFVFIISAENTVDRLSALIYSDEYAEYRQHATEREHRAMKALLEYFSATDN